jgi:hypothetical protein
MSVENQTAIELSEQELDVVAGGAITDTESAVYKFLQNNFVSSLSVSADGINSYTAASQTKIYAFANKTITLS